MISNHPINELWPADWPPERSSKKFLGYKWATPGTLVIRRDVEGWFGIIIANDKKRASVLWTKYVKENDFSSMVSPIIRQTFQPSLIKKLVSVQPMSQPSDLVFYLDYKYGANSGSSGLP
jgi:hypothetical protein